MAKKAANDTPVLTTDLVISVEGKIVESNFLEYKTELIEMIRGLNAELTTDTDFQIAAENVKGLKLAEEALADTKAKALAQAEEVQRLFTEIDEVSEEARQARLGLERQIKKRREQLVESFKEDAIASIDCANSQVYRARIAEAMKGKRTMETLEAAARHEAGVIQSEIDAARKVIDTHESQHGTTLTYDRPRLEQMEAAAVAVELGNRLERKRNEEEQKRLREEAERERRIRAEVEAEAKRKAEEEAKARMATEKPSAPAEKAIEPKADIFAPEPPKAALKTQKQEFEHFLDEVKAAFGPIKAARERLTHAENKAKARVFAEAVSRAWKELSTGG